MIGMGDSRTSHTLELRGARRIVDSSCEAPAGCVGMDDAHEVRLAQSCMFSVAASSGRCVDLVRFPAQTRNSLVSSDFEVKLCTCMQHACIIICRVFLAPGACGIPLWSVESSLLQPLRMPQHFVVLGWYTYARGRRCRKTNVDSRANDPIH